MGPTSLILFLRWLFVLKQLISLLFFLGAATSLAGTPGKDSAKGWHWYAPALLATAAESKKTDFSELEPEAQLAALQKVTHHLKTKAILSGKVADVAAYKLAQDFWAEKSTQFAIAWERMLLAYPELDYSLRYSPKNSLARFSATAARKNEAKALAGLAKDRGLVLFYRAGDPQDRFFLSTLKKFEVTEKMALLAVAIDGPDQQAALAKAKALGIGFFPALLLVNPRTGSHQIASYGVQSRAELMARLHHLATHWKPTF